jgi:hypothetical protein
MFTVGCNWRLNQLFSVAWDGRCRTTGTERNWIGVDLLRMGNWLLGAHRCARYLLLSGPSNSNPFCGCEAAALGAECVDAEASQHVESTASMLGWTRQSSAAAPFTVWPTFLQHGCCGPYGCGDGRSQRLLRVQLSGTFSGQLPPRASQPSSSSRANSSRRRKVHGSRKGSNSVPSRPATPRPFANPGSLLPSDLRSLDRRRHRRRPVRLDGQRPWGRHCHRCRRRRPPHGLRRRHNREVRLCFACAYVPCMRMHSTAD